MERSNVVVAVGEVVGLGPEAVEAVEQLRPEMAKVEVGAVVVLDLAEARRLASPGSRKLAEPSWRERSKIVRRWRRWQRSPLATRLLDDDVRLLPSTP
jgi:hypothetical protein